MNRFLKLVNFELGRFMKIYIVLLAITLISQIAGVFFTANEYMERANASIYEDSMTRMEVIEMYGEMSFSHIVRSLWFVGPIALCAAALLFYVFFIWYRDWLGKNTFIYRLLMLPTARINVFFSKAVSIFLMVLGLVSFQLILFPIETIILKWIVPNSFRLDMTVSEIIYDFEYLQILIPQSVFEFIFYYGAGFMAVLIMFTAILFERSYKWKGVLLGVGYSVLSVVIFLSPLIFMDSFVISYLYPIEIIMIEIVLGLLVLGMSIWVSNILLKKKVTV